MRKIYLASASPARRKLLKLLGVRVTVVPSRVKEQTRAGSGGYPALVKRNALCKARDVADRLHKGVVIAADTLVVQDGRVFGKPRDRAQARRMLIRLARKPQWLYTGLAVTDVEQKKTYTACERTRVYMDRLTDGEMRRYFTAVDPTVMAGGFDIQGKGAFFIRRIEGCFYNVVGLPLRSLYRLLKKCNVTLLGMVISLSLISGCASEYNIVTGQEETYYYTTEQEVSIGAATARQVEKELKPAEDPLLQERVRVIGEKIASVSDRKDITYYFKVLDDEEVNAFALPGGFIYVNKGLLEHVERDDELAAVLAHEVGHVVARHGIKRLQGLQGYSVLRILLAAAPQSAEIGLAADTAFAELLTGYSREDELLADRLGSRYAERAGYDPRAMIGFLERLREIERRKPLKPKAYFRTHPYMPDRIRVTKQEIGENIGFADYINTQEPLDGVR